MSVESENKSSDWLVTGVVVAALVAGGFYWRAQRQQAAASPPSIQAKPDELSKQAELLSPLDRTRDLVQRKLQSLKAYNQPITAEEQLKEYTRWSFDLPFQGPAFDEMTGFMVDQLIPSLWRAAQERTGSSRLITHAAMASVIHEHWPQQLLPEGHVVLFPRHPRLRRVVSEFRQDYFRDTGWHWRWIGNAIHPEVPGVEAYRGLDTYAAEELSEFLSVLAVALMEWSGEFQPAETGAEVVDEKVMRNTLAKVHEMAPEGGHARVQREVLYSELTRQQVLKAMPRPMFREVTGPLGLDFVHQPDPELHQLRARLLMPTGIAGGGVSAGDVDGDGYEDLYFAGPNGGQLWRNVGGKKLANVTAAAGLGAVGETRAGYFVDYDNDGDLDLFVTHVWAANHLYRNEGGGKFTDVTDATGLGGGINVTHEAVWFDFDRDGLLDVYVANFGRWPAGDSPNLKRRNYSAPPNQLFHHRVVEGRHVFEEVAAEMGVDDKGWTHCVGAWDFDQDGWTDLISLNDFGQTVAFRNEGGKRFVEQTRTLQLDVVHNAMNFHLLDLEHNGQLSMYITQIAKLTHRERYRKPTQDTRMRFEHLGNLRTLVLNKLLRRVPSGAFENVHDIHIEPVPLGWAWDASVFDYENDGDLDMLVLNGTEANAPKDPGAGDKFEENREFITKHADQRNAIFLSQGGYFYDVSPHCALGYVGNSRGCAWVDLDNDGDLDVVVTDYQAPARVFENVQSTGNRWIRLQPEGTRSNRNAIDARVEVRFSDQKRFDQVVSGKGFLSQNPMALHFGLGTAKQVDKVIIRWPTGQSTTHGPFAAGRLHRIKEPAEPAAPAGQ